MAPLRSRALLRRAPLPRVRLDRGARFAAPRVLTYPEVRSERIDVDAQRSLLRMSRLASSRADAAGMADEVASGRLGGIYKENQQVPALRARRIGRGWWEVIPPGRDSVLFLDPDALTRETLRTRPPIIVFRASIGSSPERLDPALRSAWATYRFFRSNAASVCAPPTPGRGQPALATPVEGVVPPVVCDIGTSTGRALPRCPVKTVSIWLNAFLHSRVRGLTRLVPGGPHAGETMMDVQTIRGRRCFLTNGRGFSPDPNAPCMLQSRIDVDVPTLGRIQRHRRDRLLRLDCDTGGVRCDAPPTEIEPEGVLHSIGFSHVRRVSASGPEEQQLLRTRLFGEMEHPCHPPFVILVELDIFISIKVPRAGTQDVVVTATGNVRNYPAYEMYMSVNGGEPDTVFTLGPAGRFNDPFGRPVDRLTHAFGVASCAV